MIISVIGGGSGSQSFAKVFKDIKVKANYIISVFDDGLTTGVLRELENIPAIGDIRKIIEILSDHNIVNLFEEKLSENFHNMKLGNLIILSYIRKYGFIDGILKIQNDLNVFGNIIPISEDNSYLCVKIGNNIIKKVERKLEIGEINKFDDIFLEPKAKISKIAKDEIINSDIIFITFGSFFGSIMVNFLVDGFVEALEKSKAKIYFFINRCRDSETKNFNSVEELINYVEKYTKRIDYYVIDKNTDFEIRSKKDNYIFYDFSSKDKCKHNLDKLKSFIMDLINAPGGI